MERSASCTCEALKRIRVMRRLPLTRSGDVGRKSSGSNLLLVRHERHAATIRRPTWNVDRPLTAEECRREIAYRAVAQIHEPQFHLPAERMVLALVLQKRQVHDPAPVGRGMRKPVGEGVVRQLLARGPI